MTLHQVGCRAYCAALLALFTLTASAATAQQAAQATPELTERLVTEAVQNRLDGALFRHLRSSRQIDINAYIARQGELRARERAYVEKVRGFPQEEQLRLRRLADDRYATEIVPLQARWEAEARRLGEERKAAAAAGTAELRTDATEAATLQVGRIFLQRALDQGAIPVAEAAAQDSAAVARIQELQAKYRAKGDNWATSFNADVQGYAATIRAERERDATAADSTSPWAVDAKRVSEFELSKIRTDIFRARGAMSDSDAVAANALVNAELADLRARYAATGALASDAVRFGDRVEALVRRGERDSLSRWQAEARQRVAPTRALAPATPYRTLTAEELQAEAERVKRARRAEDADKWNQGLLLLAIGGAPLLLFAVTGLNHGRKYREPGGEVTGFTDGVATIDFGRLTGEVIDTHKRSETYVSSSGGGGYMHQGTGHVAAPTISSTVVTKHEFWLRTPDGSERSVQLSGHDVPLRAGQRVTLITAEGHGALNAYHVMLVNHTALGHAVLRKAEELHTALGLDAQAGCAAYLLLPLAFLPAIIQPVLVLPLLALFAIGWAVRSNRNARSVASLREHVRQYVKQTT